MENLDTQDFVKVHLSSVYFYILLSLSIIGVGIFLFLYKSDGGNESWHDLPKLGGAVVSALSSFPIREIVLKREKIGTVKRLEKMRLKLYNQQPRNAETDQLLAEVNKKLWDFIVAPLN